MVLELNILPKLIQEKKNSNLVSIAVRNEERLRFHCTTMMDGRNVPAALYSFEQYVKSILLSEDKSKMFLTFMRFPIATNSLVDSIFTELNKVFYGQNFVNKVAFSSQDIQENYEQYITNSVNIHEIFKTKGYEAMVNNINSIVVVDLPDTQTTDRPEPYFYFLNIANVMAFEVKADSDVFEYLIYKDEVTQNIIIIDDMKYIICEVDKTNDDIKVLRTANHDLGYVPAKFFWKDYLNGISKCIKKSPISKELDKLDYLEFKLISKRIADLGGEYPITYSYEETRDCDFHTNELHCKDGYLVDDRDQFAIGGDGSVMKCPICAEKGFRGAGTHITVPIPDEGEPDISKPVGMMVTPPTTLKNISDSIDMLEMKIYNSVVGYDGFFSENSMSDTQIRSNFENRKTVLCSIKTNFEECETFIVNTICKMRYDKAYIGCTIDYGTEFYLYKVEDIRSMYKTAKEAGASETELDYLDEQIIRTELRNNQQQLRRALYIRSLEPYRNLSVKDVADMASSGIIDTELAKIKAQFPTLIDRFERENCNILEFGSNTDENTKANAIINQLKKYVNYGTTIIQ
jgi:hypothetical protein